MAGNRAETLPEGAREWVDRGAAELGVDPQAVLNRAVEAYRHLEAESDDPHADREALETRIAGLASRPAPDGESKPASVDDSLTVEEDGDV